MNDKHQILSELEASGVIVDERGHCRFTYAGEELNKSVQETIKFFNSRAVSNKQHFVELWDELIKHMSVIPLAFYEGAETTQRMFINSVRQSLRLAKKIQSFTGTLPSIKRLLKMDSKMFSESFMSQLVEFSICVEWVYHLIKSDIYKVYLLERVAGKDVTASGAMGDVDLPMAARVQPIEEESEDDLEQGGRLHPLYTRQFRQHDLQNGLDVYDFEDRVYRLINEPRAINRGDDRQPNRSLSRTLQ